MNRCQTILAMGALLVPCLFPPPATAQTVVLGAENDAAPWSYADGTGYVNDLVRAAYTAVGWDVRFEVLPYARCKLEATSGQLAGCFSASKTPETERDLQFPSTPVFSAVNGLYVAADSALRGCSATEWGRKIKLGLVNEYEYTAKLDAMVADGDAVASKVRSEAALLRMLAVGRFDAVVVNTDPIKRIEYVARMAALQPHFKLACIYGADPAYIGFSRNHPQAPAALAAFDRGMGILKKNGMLKKLEKIWAQRALKNASPEK